MRSRATFNLSKLQPTGSAPSKARAAIFAERISPTAAERHGAPPGEAAAGEARHADVRTRIASGRFDTASPRYLQQRNPVE